MLIKKSILKNHRDLENSIDDIINFSDHTIQLTELKVHEKSLIAEGLLLKACALWEKFLEKEIVYLVSLNTEKLINEVELTSDTKLNLKLIRAILFSNYFKDFHDIERSKSFFRTFVAKKYNPFANLPSDLLNKVMFAYKIRNYLAHYSEYSRKQLLNHYVKHYHYKKFVEPGKFLIKKNSKYLTDLIHNFSLLSASIRRELK